MKWLYGPCDPVLVPSGATRDLLRGNGYRAERLRLWSRGVDAQRFGPFRSSAALRDEWHVDERRPAILYAGRLSREKGLALVAPIQQLLDRHRVAHRFIFVGGGPMAAELRELCPDGRFMGELGHDEVARAMASADVFLFPSATDSLGNVVLEAQASGLPVVVSDQGGPREHIVPDATGYICPAGDPAGFASRLMTLLRHRDLRRAMGHAARDFALTRTWPAALAPLYEAWRDAARRSAALHGVFPRGEQPWPADYDASDGADVRLTPVRAAVRLADARRAVTFGRSAGESSSSRSAAP